MQVVSLFWGGGGYGGVCLGAVIFLINSPLCTKWLQDTGLTWLTQPRFRLPFYRANSRPLRRCCCQVPRRGSWLQGFFAVTKEFRLFLNRRCIFQKSILFRSLYLSPICLYLRCRLGGKGKVKKCAKTRENEKKKKSAVCRSWSSFVYIPKSITPDSLLLYK